MPLLWTLVFIVIVYVGMTLAVYLRQPRYVYVPSREVTQDPSAIGVPFEAIDLDVRGQVVKAWFVAGASSDPNRPVVLFCHGNGGNLGYRLDFVRTFREMGLDLMIFDYRGYGESDGEPNEKGTYEDAMAAWTYLVETRKISPERIIIHGRSLGGAIATWLTVQTNPAGLVIESSFTSARRMAADMFPILPVRWFCQFRYDSLGRMPSIRCPVLIAHGEADRVIAYRHGRELFAAANEPKTFIELQGSHDDSGVHTNPHFREACLEFAKRCTGRN